MHALQFHWPSHIPDDSNKNLNQAIRGSPPGGVESWEQYCVRCFYVLTICVQLESNICHMEAQIVTDFQPKYRSTCKVSFVPAGSSHITVNTSTDNIAQHASFMRQHASLCVYSVNNSQNKANNSKQLSIQCVVFGAIVSAEPHLKPQL